MWRTCDRPLPTPGSSVVGSLPVEAEEFVRRYPEVWHLAEVGSMPSIHDHGLLSTSALLDLHRVTGPDRVAAESTRRARAVELTSAAGRAVLRDQLPMTDRTLTAVLVEMTPTDWYRLLNGKVFFWVSLTRMTKHREARTNRDRAHDLLTVDTAELLRRHGDRVTLSPINSGAAFPLSRLPRGRDTFRSLAAYPWEQRLRTAPREPAVELTVEHGVPDVSDFATVERLPPAGGPVVGPT